MSATPSLADRASADAVDAPVRSRLPDRLRGPRIVGLLVGAIGYGAALAQIHAPPFAWWLLVAHVVLWPHVAYALSSHSARPREAELRNLVLDGFLLALWWPVIGFNALPTAMSLTMVLMDALAVAGARLCVRTLLAALTGALVTSLLVDWQPLFASSLPTLLACLPTLMIYPLTVGYVMHRMSVELGANRHELAHSERLHRDTLNAMDAAIVLYDADDRLVLCNDRYRTLHAPIADLLTPGQGAEAVLRGMAERGLVSIPRAAVDTWVAGQLERNDLQSRETREMGDGGWRRVVDQRLPDGSLLSFSTDIGDLVRREQELRRLNDERDEYARQLREVNERLELLSQTDALTGLANRRLFDQRLMEEWQRGRRHRSSLALLLIDVDHFKRFNDHRGHLEGDACLRRVAGALQGCARRAGDLVARYGGEEFALLLPQTSAADAAQVAAHCIEAVDAAAIAHGDSPLGPRVTISVGVAALALSSASGDDPSRLIGSADEGLYRAKGAGRHQLATVD